MPRHHDAIRRDTTGCDAAGHDATHRDTAGRDTAGLDTAGLDATHPDAGRHRPVRRVDRRPTALLAALVLSAAYGGCASAQPTPTVTIRPVNGSASEEARAEQLRRVLDRWDVEPWIYTREIAIEDRVIPHSHPVLTLSGGPASDDEVLASFLHEQFHWLEDANPGFTAAMRAFAEAYPDAPAGGPEGARDLESTYRHLVVNDLEYQALTALVGRERAREILEGHGFYTWIYDRVLNDPVVRRITEEQGMTLDEVAVR